MLKHIFNKDDSLFFIKKKLALSWRAPQENDAKFRFPIHVQGIRQFHDNCKIAKCQIVATLAPVYVTSLSVLHVFILLNKVKSNDTGMRFFRNSGIFPTSEVILVKIPDPV